MASICVGVSAGLAYRIKAITPATCGDAIDVPCKGPTVGMRVPLLEMVAKVLKTPSG
jgi:hypothetical protein